MVQNLGQFICKWSEDTLRLVFAKRIASDGIMHTTIQRSRICHMRTFSICFDDDFEMNPRAGISNSIPLIFYPSTSQPAISLPASSHSLDVPLAIAEEAGDKNAHFDHVLYCRQVVRVRVRRDTCCPPPRSRGPREHLDGSLSGRDLGRLG